MCALLISVITRSQGLLSNKWRWCNANFQSITSPEVVSQDRALVNLGECDMSTGG